MSLFNGGLSLAAGAVHHLSRFLPPGGAEEPDSDSLLENQGRVTNPALTGGIGVGVVTDFVAGTQNYKVNTLGGGPVIPCVRLNFGSTSPLGVSDGDTLQPGQTVLYAHHWACESGIILGAYPLARRKPEELRPDVYYQGFAAGPLADVGHQAPLKLPKHSIVDNSARTPQDSVELSGFNRTSATGIMLSVDDFMAMLRINEATGLYMFYNSGLARLAGQQLEIWSPSWLGQYRNDAGELLHEESYFAYPWEKLGRFAQGPTIKQNEISEGSAAGPIEPIEVDATPFARNRVYRGRLAARHEQVVALPVGESAWHKADTPHVEGLLEEVRTWRGEYGLRSASGFVLKKSGVIPVPKRVKSFDDKEGDDPDSGFDPAAGDPLSPPKPAESEVSAYIESQNVGDLHDYLFNWSAARAFHEHEKDFDVPEESATKAGQQGRYEPEYATLKDKQLLDLPPTFKIKAGEKEGEVEVYVGDAFVSFGRAGNVNIVDAWGSEYEMTGGRVSVSCPGEMFFSAGTNIVMQAGRDIITKAQGSTDITSSTGSLRLKSETGMHIIAANGEGEHGLIIESRGKSVTYDYKKAGDEAKSPGITMLCRGGNVSALARDVVLRSGVGVQGRSAIDQNGLYREPGDIYFDAGRGSGEINMRADSVTRIVSSRVEDQFGDADQDGGVSAVNEFTADNARINGRVYCGGDLTVNGSGLFAQSVQIISGHISTPSGGFVGRLPRISIDFGSKRLQRESDNGKKKAKSARRDYKNGLSKRWYGTDRALSSENLVTASGSLRTTEDHGTEDYFVFSPRWSRQGQAPGVWQERQVSTPNDHLTEPFPGRERSEQECLVSNKLLLRDESGKLKKPGPEYDGLDLPKEDTKTLANSFPIVG